MRKLWRYIPKGLRDRPFDAYTALALMAVGIYGLIDPYFPETHGSAISSALFHVIEVYFVLASSILLTALLCNPKKHPSFYFFGQMYSWAFISAAGLAIMCLQVYQAANSECHIEEPFLFWFIFFIFGCVSFASTIRSIDMYLYVEGKN